MLLGYKPSGKEHRKWFYSKNRHEVVAAVNRLAADLLEGVEIEREHKDHVTVRQYMTEWLRDIAPSTVAVSTLVRYESAVRTHILPELGDFELSELTPQQVQALHTKQSKKGLAPATVRYSNMVLRSALKNALTWGLVTRNVAALVTLPRIEQKPRIVLTAAQVQTFVESIRGHRLEAFFIVDMLHGLRRGEMLGLRWEDVDLDAGLVRVEQTIHRAGGKLHISKPKTAMSKGIVYLAPVAVEALRAHRTRQMFERALAGPRWRESGLVFTTRWGTGIEPRNINRTFDSLLKKAKLPHVTVHGMRHTAASLMFSQGANLKEVSEALRHSRVGITADTYIDLYDPGRRAVADKVGKLITREWEAIEPDVVLPDEEAG